MAKHIDEYGNALAFSEIEDVYPRNYEDLCVFLKAFREPISSGDGKIYNANIGKAVWANIVCRKRPIHNYDTQISESIYQLVGELGFNGDFPAMLYLYDRLDVTESEYNAICRDSADNRSAIFRWTRELFSHASKINAVHGNGNVNVFQYVNTPDDNDNGTNAYQTPETNISNILALFGGLTSSKGKVGEIIRGKDDAENNDDEISI